MPRQKIQAVNDEEVNFLEEVRSLSRTSLSYVIEHAREDKDRSRWESMRTMHLAFIDVVCVCLCRVPVLSICDIFVLNTYMVCLISLVEHRMHEVCAIRISCASWVGQCTGVALGSDFQMNSFLKCSKFARTSVLRSASLRQEKFLVYELLSGGDLHYYLERSRFGKENWELLSGCYSSYSLHF